MFIIVVLLHQNVTTFECGLKFDDLTPLRQLLPIIIRRNSTFYIY